jgi:damage-control phosphatase, subfamily I
MWESKKMKASVDCLHCIMKKSDEIYSQYEKNEDMRIAFLKHAMTIIASSDEQDSAPQIMTRIMRAISQHTDVDDHYLEEKRQSNELMLGMAMDIEDQINKADDPLTAAIQYALAGNYIDFGVLQTVDDDQLRRIVEKAHELNVDDDVLARLKSDLSDAKSLVYLTDNAGEIVFDKLFIKTMIAYYPDIKISVIVKGFPALNDATMKDAIDIGLLDVANIYDNGYDAPGTILEKISQSAKARIDQADVIISKGMGNFETLLGCKKNIYYAFLCKCKLFTERFGLPLFDGVFKHETDFDS